MFKFKLERTITQWQTDFLPFIRLFYREAMGAGEYPAKIVLSLRFLKLVASISYYFSNTTESED